MRFLAVASSVVDTVGGAGSEMVRQRDGAAAVGAELSRLFLEMLSNAAAGPSSLSKK